MGATIKNRYNGQITTSGSPTWDNIAVIDALDFLDSGDSGSTIWIETKIYGALGNNVQEASVVAWYHSVYRYRAGTLTFRATTLSQVRLETTTEYEYREVISGTDIEIDVIEIEGSTLYYDIKVRGIQPNE